MSTHWYKELCIRTVLSQRVVKWKFSETAFFLRDVRYQTASTKWEKTLSMLAGARIIRDVRNTDQERRRNGNTTSEITYNDNCKIVTCRASSSCPQQPCTTWWWKPARSF